MYVLIMSLTHRYHESEPLFCAVESTMGENEGNRNETKYQVAPAAHGVFPESLDFDQFKYTETPPNKYKLKHE